MLRFARHDDIPALRRLWDDCFPNDGAFCDLLLGGGFNPAHVFVYELDGEPVAMVHFIIEPLIVRGISLNAAYLYGVGTRPDCRGRGIASELIGGLLRQLSGDKDTADSGENADVAVIVPQSASLFGYYERLGFVTAFYADVTTVGCGDASAKAAQSNSDNIDASTQSDGANEHIGTNAMRIGNVGVNTVRTEHVGTSAVRVENVGADAADYAALNGIFEAAMYGRTHLARSASHWRNAIKAAECWGGGLVVSYECDAVQGYAVFDSDGISELFCTSEAHYNALISACIGALTADAARLADTAVTTDSQPRIILRSPACPSRAKAFGVARMVNIASTLNKLGANEAYELHVSDGIIPSNNGAFAVSNGTVVRAASAGFALCQDEVLKTILSGGLPPYMNLVYS